MLSRARAFTITYAKTFGPFAAEGAWLIRGDRRSTWFAERQVCSVNSFHLFYFTFPLSVL